MIRNANYWKDWFTNVFVPEIRALEVAVFSKMLPSFDNIAEEAEKLTEKEYERLGNRSADADDTDMGDIAEKAQDKGIEYYSLMSKMKREILAIFYVMLYRLFEQQLFYFYRKEILGVNEEYNIEDIKWKDLLARFQGVGIKLNDLKTYKNIHILGLIANIVKHGEGRSEKELRKIESAYFKYQKKGFRVFISEDILDSLKISEANFLEQIRNVVAFWNELSSVITVNTGI